VWVVVGVAVVVEVPSPQSQMYEFKANPAPGVELLASTEIVFEFGTEFNAVEGQTLMTDASVNCAVGFVHGVAQKTVAFQPLLVVDASDLNSNVIHPSGLVDTNLTAPTFPQILSSWVFTAP
jgi:hypothetical protein